MYLLPKGVQKRILPESANNARDLFALLSPVIRLVARSPACLASLTTSLSREPRTARCGGLNGGIHQR
jgi:hypothetical protein